MTALSFDLDPVDTAVIDLLETVTNLGVQVGSVTDSDGDSKTIGAPLPYVLYGSNLPWSSGPRRMAGGRANTTDFTASYVHNSDPGAKAVAVAVRDLLDGHYLPGLGRIRLADPGEPVIVRRDPTWTRPGGLPLFYAADRYYVL